MIKDKINRNNILQNYDANKYNISSNYTINNDYNDINTGTLLINKNRLNGVYSLIGIVLMSVFASEFNLLGFIYPYLLSYFRSYGHDITLGDFTGLPICWVLSVCVSGPIVIKIQERIGFKNLFGFFMFISVILNYSCSFITNYKIFIIYYGLTGGFLQSGFMVLPSIHIWRFFDSSYKEIINGIIYCCFAISPLITSLIVFITINPNNIRMNKIETTLSGKEILIFDYSIGRNIPYFFKVFSIFSMSAGIIGYCLTKEPIEIKDKLIISKYSNNNSNKDTNDAYNKTSFNLNNNNNIRLILLGDLGDIENKSFNKYINNNTDTQNFKIITIFNVFNNYTFRHLSLFSFCIAFFPILINFSFKSIGLINLNDDKFVTLCGTFGAVVNGFFRLIDGLLYKKYGFKNFFMCLIIIQSSFSFMFYDILSKYKLGFFISVCIYELCFSWISVAPLMCRDLFGINNAATYYSYCYISITFSMIIALNLYNIFEYYFKVSYLLYLTGFISLLSIYPLNCINFVFEQKFNSLQAVI